MKRCRHLLFALLFLAGFSFALTSINSKGQQQFQSTPLSGLEVPGPVTDEQAQEGFLRILLEDQKGADKDWKMRSSYLRYAGFTNDQIERVKPVIENFKLNIENLDDQSLALSEENFANPSQSIRNQITAIEREKKDYIASTYTGVSQLTDTARLNGHLNLKIKPKIKHFTSKKEDKKIGLLDDLFRRHFTVDAQTSPCTASGSVTSQTWIDYVALTAYSTGSIISYTNSCGHSNWTETAIRHNGVPYQVPPTYYFPLDPGGELPLLDGDFEGTYIGYTYCTMIAHAMGWAGAGSSAPVSGTVAVTKLTPGNGNISPGGTVSFVAEVKGTGNIGVGNIGVRVLIDSNPEELTFSPVFPKTKTQTAASFLRVEFGASTHSNQNTHGPVVFTCGITEVPSTAIAGGMPQTSTICFGSTQGGQVCQ